MVHDPLAVPELDVALVPMESFALTGLVADESTGSGIGGAVVEVRNEQFDLMTTTLPDGVFDIPTVFEDLYDVKAGRWGWHTVCLEGQSLTPATSPYTIELPAGYRDEFTLDLGWTVSSTAPRGEWERGAPVGTTFGNEACNPGADLIDDCGAEAYVTGNGGGDAGNDDVDDGATTLESPEFDASAMLDPYVRYHRWFFNAGGSGAPNDRLRVQLSNGAQTVTIETITPTTPGMGSWQAVELRMADFIEPTAQMVIRFIAEDLAPGHLVEAGVDGFEVVDLGSSGVTEAGSMDVRVWPTPNNGLFQLAVPGHGPGTVTMFDGTGRQVLGALPINSEVMTVDTDLPDGVYHVVVLREGRRSVLPVVVAR